MLDIIDESQHKKYGHCPLRAFNLAEKKDIIKSDYIHNPDYENLKTPCKQITRSSLGGQKKIPLVVTTKLTLA